MSVSGLWIVVAANDDAVRRYGIPLREAAATCAERPAVSQAWHAWLADPGAVGPRKRVPSRGRNVYDFDEPSRSFHDLFVDGTPHEAEEIILQRRDSVLWTVDPEPACVVTRKLSPVATLFHGLGPGRVRLLPGFLGDFALSAAELAGRLPVIISAFELDAGERTRVLARMAEWKETGDSDPDLDELLDLVPRKAEAAAARNLGLISAVGLV